MWQAETRAEREARSAAVAEARVAREKSKRQALSRRMPKDVIMSDKQRRMVEGVLRGLSGDPALSSETAADEQGMPIEAPASEWSSDTHMAFDYFIGKAMCIDFSSFVWEDAHGAGV